MLLVHGLAMRGVARLCVDKSKDSCAASRGSCIGNTPRALVFFLWRRRRQRWWRGLFRKLPVVLGDRNVGDKEI